ncbi:MAG: hypothetical protein RR653_12585, partial [Clostridia bacterium]
VPLTLTMARELLRKALELPTRVRATLREDPDCCGDAKVYQLWIGKLAIVVQNDWCNHNGLFSITIRQAMGYQTCVFYDPLTLDEAQDAAIEHILQQNQEEAN